MSEPWRQGFVDLQQEVLEIMADVKLLDLRHGDEDYVDAIDDALEQTIEQGATYAVFTDDDGPSAVLMPYEHWQKFIQLTQQPKEKTDG